MNTRRFLHDNIATIINTFDTHDASICDDGTYRCLCRWKGTETGWHEHLAEAMSDAVCEQTVQLPLMEVGA